MNRLNSFLILELDGQLSAGHNLSRADHNQDGTQNPIS